jgi:hypothetical protein
MPESYYAEEPDSIDEQLDELLCEYVDGTMDPSVKIVFEEYLAENPDLAAHVRCLCETRRLLCRIGQCECATATSAQLRHSLARELSRQNRSSVRVWTRLGNIALATSTVGLLLIFGMMAGISVVHRTTVSGSQETAQAGEYPDSAMETPTDAHGFIGRSMRLESVPGSSNAGIFGPVSTLPVVAGSGYMTPMSRAFSRAGMIGPIARRTIREIAP